MPPKKRSITAEDLYKIEVLSSARLSPDGEHVVYAQQRVDRKTEKKYSNLWIVPTGGKPGDTPRQFTYGDQTDAAPRWSPDGTQIAFLSNRENKEKPPQLYLIPFAGGEARKLTSFEGVITSFSWSPDGKRLLLTARKLDPEEMERQKDESKKKLGVVERHYQRLAYKLDGYGYLPHQRAHLWLVDAQSGKARQLTDGDVWDELHPAWSPDGKTIAFTSNHAPDPDSDPDAFDLFTIPASGGEPVRLATPEGGKFEPSYSPDGRWIAYYGVEGKGEWYKNDSLWVIPSDGSAPAQNLTAHTDMHVSAQTINDIGSPEGRAPIWSKNSNTIYFPVALHGSSLLMSIDCDGSNLKTVVDGPGVVSSYSFNKSQDRLAYLFAKIDEPFQVYTLKMSDHKPVKLTDTNREIFASVNLGKVEEHWIKGPDDNDIQGWILKPPDFDPSKKYPSILEIHGGPLTQYGFNFMHEFYFLAAHGYVVSFSNPRGGQGYGEAHAKAIWGGWGDADYADLMAWTDYVASQPYIDPEKMGVGGGSYGGYMTVWIIGHTQRFKAGVAMRCVSNLVSLWGSSDMNWVFQQTLNNKPPYEDLQKYWDHSPMAYIGNAITPTLVIHNEGDLRCPIEQGEQVFVALKRQGVDTEMVRFPDEFHGLSRGGRTDRRIARLNHILRWFDKYLK